MKQEIKNLENKVIKEVNLDKAIFGIEAKEDIISRMIRYQLAKKRSGNHKTKGISEISGTTKKPFKQILKEELNQLNNIDKASKLRETNILKHKKFSVNKIRLILTFKDKFPIKKIDKLPYSAYWISGKKAEEIID